MKRALLLPAVAVLFVVLGGCDMNIEHRQSQHETQSIELDKAEMARVEIKMGAGELNVEGGSPKMMDADFEYNIPSLKPLVHYDASSFRGQLTIEQPSGSRHRSNVVYKWNIRLNDQVPLDVVTELGAGEARLDLGSITLRSVNVHMGVGQVRLDLRGKPSRDYTVSIHGGVGQATVYLPRDTGIVANASGGIGDISVRGLEKRDGQWVNPGHENSPVTIHLDVHGGVGQIELIVQ